MKTAHKFLTPAKHKRKRNNNEKKGLIVNKEKLFVENLTHDICSVKRPNCHFDFVCLYKLAVMMWRIRLLLWFFFFDRLNPEEEDFVNVPITRPTRILQKLGWRGGGGGDVNENDFPYTSSPTFLFTRLAVSQLNLYNNVRQERSNKTSLLIVDCQLSTAIPAGRRASVRVSLVTDRKWPIIDCLK